MSQPNRGRNSQAKNHLITIVLALIIAGLAMRPPTPTPRPRPASPRR